MSRLSGVLGALQGLEKGMVGRDQAKSQLAQTLFDLRKYQETTLPESQQQVRESVAKTGLYETQTGQVEAESRLAPTKQLTELAKLELTQIELEAAKKRRDELKKFADANPNIPVWSGAYGNKIAAEYAKAQKDYYEALDDIAIREGWKAGGGVAETVRGKVAATQEETQKRITGAEAEKIFAERGGGGLEATARGTRLTTEIQRGPITIETALQEMTQAQITTRERTAGEPYKIASYPLTQQLLQTQVDQANQNLLVSQTYDMKQAQANLTRTQEETTKTKKEIQRIDAEMKDKAVLDGIAVNSGLTNPITNKPVTTWDEYKIVMPFKLDEQLALVRAKSTGSSGLPTMSQAIKQITIAKDATLFGGQIPFKSEEMVRNFIDYIPYFLASGQDPNAAWSLSKMVYVTSEPLETLQQKAVDGNDTLSQRFMAGYLPPDMVVNDEQIQRVMTSIQQALANQSRTSAAGGTTPKVYGPPTPPGLREQVAGGSITDTTFGLDSATRQRIASIIDVYRNDPADLQKRLIKEIAKENDMNKRNQMALFAEDYVRTKR